MTKTFDLMTAVREFNDAFEVAQPATPIVVGDAEAVVCLDASYTMSRVAEDLKGLSTLLGASVPLIRLQLIQEELAELAEALSQNDRVGTLDALADLSYVVDGAWLALGYSHLRDEALRRVHESNMSKLGEDGLPIKGPSGRVEKGPGYHPPRLEDLIGRQKE